ncbi:MAG: hypothetical protein JNK05_11775 [Myxococcales bacterium]|nr:hypothetical protein [Myxococcales bacterium]
MSQTIKQLADELQISVSSVKNALRKATRDGALPDRSYASADASLDKVECDCVRSALERGEIERRGRIQDVETAPSPEERSIDASDVAALPPPPWRAIESVGATPHDAPLMRRVFVHEEVLEFLSGKDATLALRKAYTHRLRQLHAHGTTTRSKGVKGANRGWTRVPLGGNSGFHYYLWLASYGDALGGQDARATYRSFPEHSVFLRAIRHHDDTDEHVLKLDRATEYTELGPERAFATTDEDGAADPYTPEQRAALDDRSSVRVLRGHPGAGKTITLCAAAESLEGRVLYLSFSSELVRTAREWIQVATRGAIELEAVAWDDFLDWFDPNGRHKVRPMREQIERLEALLQPSAAQLGPWSSDGRVLGAELYAELHAHRFGAVLPVGFRNCPPCGGDRLSDATYRALRENPLGPRAVDGAIKAAAKLDEVTARELFPAPTRASTLAARFVSGGVDLDRREWTYDWILVDELQDLTLAEQWLLIDILARMGAKTTHRPGIVVAGDEAQTVRFTAFEWGPFGDLLSSRLAVTKGKERGEHELLANLRAPRDLALFLEGMRRDLYHRLYKQQRPRGRLESEAGDSTVGRIVLTEMPDDAALERVFQAFASAKGTAALLFPGVVVPERYTKLAEKHDMVLWTSVTAKGLEFRVVGVLDVSDALEQIDRLTDSARRDRFSGERARAAVDQLMVATSRSAETLVLLSDRWRLDRVGRIDQWRRDDDPDQDVTGVFSLDDLAELLDADASDARSKVTALIAQSERAAQQDEREDAERLARSACSLLGPAGRPGAAGPELRAHARRTWARALAVLVFESRDAFVRSADPLERASRLFREAGNRDMAQLVGRFARLYSEPFKGADVAEALGVVARSLAEEQSDEPRVRRSATIALSSIVAGWAAGTDLPSNLNTRLAALRALVELEERALIQRESFALAREQIAQRMVEETLRANGQGYDDLRPFVRDERVAQRFDAREAERREDWQRAALLWERIGSALDVVRCLRKHGSAREAADVAERNHLPQADFLRWYSSLTALLSAPPDGALEPEERARLVAALGGAIGAELTLRDGKIRRKRGGS